MSDAAIVAKPRLPLTFTYVFQLDVPEEPLVPRIITTTTTTSHIAKSSSGL